MRGTGADAVPSSSVSCPFAAIDSAGSHGQESACAGCRRTRADRRRHRSVTVRPAAGRAERVHTAHLPAVSIR